MSTYFYKQLDDFQRRIIKEYNLHYFKYQIIQHRVSFKIIIIQNRISKSEEKIRPTFSLKKLKKIPLIILLPLIYISRSDVQKTVNFFFTITYNIGLFIPNKCPFPLTVN